MRTLDLSTLQQAQGGFISVITNAIKTATASGDSYYKVEVEDLVVSSY